MKHKIIVYVLSFSATFCAGFVAGAIADAYSDDIQNMTSKFFKHGKTNGAGGDNDKPSNSEPDPDDSDGVKTVMTSDLTNFDKPDPRDILKYRKCASKYSPNDEDKFDKKKKKAKDRKLRQKIEDLEEEDIFNTNYDEEAENEDAVDPDELDETTEIEESSDSDIDEDDSDEDFVTEEDSESVLPPKIYEPFEISDVDYREGDYRKMHLTYFPSDDVLADIDTSNGEPVDPLYMIGKVAYDTLLEGDEDFYVRNDNIEYDIRVITDKQRDYSAVARALNK